MMMRALLIAACAMAPTYSLADVLRCNVTDYKEFYFHHHAARHQL